MTAFTIEVVLLLAAAFLVGLAVGYRLGRRRPSVPPVREGEVTPPKAPIAVPLPPSRDPVEAAPQEQASSASEPRPAPEPAEREPDLFSRLGIINGAVTLPPEELEDLDEPLPPPPRPAPAPISYPKGSDGHPGAPPPILSAAEGTGPDDLKLLKGIGPQNERRLNALGIFHFRQIAAWTPQEAAWVGSYLAFPGRIEREDWVGQAKVIVGAASRDAGEAPSGEAG